jgi:hypothetical protein
MPPTAQKKRELDTRERDVVKHLKEHRPRMYQELVRNGQLEATARAAQWAANSGRGPARRIARLVRIPLFRTCDDCGMSPCRPVPQHDMRSARAR